jgi:O-antigen/teichoic acid export membrane protein
MEPDVVEHRKGAETHRGTREQRMRRGSVSAVAARLVSLIAGFASVPILLNHLGTERFGVWATITSLTFLLTFADLGLSNGVVNAVADADATDDRLRMSRDVSSVLLVLSAVGFAIIPLFFLLEQFMDVADLVGRQADLPSREVRSALLAFVTCLAIGLPLGIVVRIQMGLQQTAVAYAWIALGSVLGVLAMLIAVALDAGLGGVVLATTGGPVVAAAINAVVLFGRSRPWLRPRCHHVSWTAASMLMRAGGLWLVIQCATAISYQSDALIISHILGADAVTSYTVPMRLFLFMPALMTFALLPLWPAIRSALARDEVQWVRQATYRMTAIAAIAVLVSTAFLLWAAPRIIDVWTGGQVEASAALLRVLALWALTTCLVTPLAFLLAGLNALRFILITNVCMAMLNLALSIPLAYAIGIEGVALGTVIANFTCIIVPSLWYLPRVFARLATA